MKPPFIRSPYNYDMNEAGDESGLACKDPTLTQQSFKDEADINTLVERFHLTGEMPQLQQLPSYDDYTGLFDYQTAMNAVIAARQTFESLPAKTRARFHNEPQEFLEFFEDPENRPEAIRMGLIQAPPEVLTKAQEKDKRLEPEVPETKGETPTTPKE